MSTRKVLEDYLRSVGVAFGRLPVDLDNLITRFCLFYEKQAVSDTNLNWSVEQFIRLNRSILPREVSRVVSLGATSQAFRPCLCVVIIWFAWRRDRVDDSFFETVWFDPFRALFQSLNPVGHYNSFQSLPSFRGV